MSNDKSSLRTDLGRVRHLGSARSGTADNWAMRLSSAALIPLSIAFVVVLLSLVGKDYNAARALMGRPVPALIFIAFVLTGVWHMQIGMKSIIIDYVHSAHAKEWALIVNICFAALVGLACIYATLRIGFA